ncbi:hypothetical protein CN601_09220 [Bacillus sp. AFS017336]|nr:hypothetical protein CN692_11855 [Bacillus sp. AFS002410]PEL11963.1 hypothetical protein CN601_09220 [Bacillus sp. AFS017336]
MDYPSFVLKFCIIIMVLPITLACCYFGYVDKNYQIVIFGFGYLFLAGILNYIIFINGNKKQN